jgi:hypothetical protein
MSKNQIVVLSDIHIGTNSPINWYQANFDETSVSCEEHHYATHFPN